MNLEKLHTLLSDITNCFIPVSDDNLDHLLSTPEKARLQQLLDIELNKLSNKCNNDKFYEKLKYVKLFDNEHKYLGCSFTYAIIENSDKHILTHITVNTHAHMIRVIQTKDTVKTYMQLLPTDVCNNIDKHINTK